MGPISDRPRLMFRALHGYIMQVRTHGSFSDGGRRKAFTASVHLESQHSHDPFEILISQTYRNLLFGPVAEGQHRPVLPPQIDLGKPDIGKQPLRAIHRSHRENAIVWRDAVGRSVNRRRAMIVVQRRQPRGFPDRRRLNHIALTFQRTRQ